MTSPQSLPPKKLGKGFRSIMDRVSNKKILTPYLDLGITSAKWPLKYTITIDSSPYYGVDPETREPDGYFHPSTHSLMGERLLWYTMHPAYRDQLEKEPPSLQREMTFAMGSALHGVVQTQLTMLGLCKCSCAPGEIHTCGDIEVLHKGTHNDLGKLDFIATLPMHGRVAVEMKTMNTIAFGKLDDTVESMKPEWKAQLSLALHNLGFSWGILLVMQSGWPYRFEEIRFDRDDALLSEIFERFDRVAEHLALDTPPEPCCGYGSKTMKSCPARYVCWLKNDKAVRR